MPHRKRPITFRPKHHDESTGNYRETRGKHREEDEALAGRGSTKGGLNRGSGAGTGSSHQGRTVQPDRQEIPDARGGER